MCLIINRKLLFFIFSFVLFNGYSQKFIFEITPGLKFYGVSFQNLKGAVTKGGNNSYLFQNIKRVGSYDPVGNQNIFGLEPEINLAFLEINEKWKLSAGFTTFIVRSKINANTTGKSYLPFSDSSTLYTEYISKQLINKYVQFSLFATRSFKTRTKLDEKIINYFSIGIGINKPSMFNSQNEKEYYESYLYDNFGYVKEITYKKSLFFGSLTPLIVLKYELEIQSRKSSYGIIRLNFSYIQGFSKHNTLNLTSASIGGANINIESTNRGSGFRIGLSKTFKFSKSKTNENQ